MRSATGATNRPAASSSSTRRARRKARPLLLPLAAWRRAAFAAPLTAGVAAAGEAGVRGAAAMPATATAATATGAADTAGLACVAAATGATGASSPAAARSSCMERLRLGLPLPSSVLPLSSAASGGCPASWGPAGLAKWLADSSQPPSRPSGVGATCGQGGETEMNTNQEM